MLAKPKTYKAPVRGTTRRPGNEASPKKAAGPSDPETLVNKLFAKTFAPQRAIYDAVVAYLRKLETVISPRRGHVALFRLRQLGAIKPSKEGLLVGLALQKYPKSAKLKDVKKLGGGDRNKKALVLSSLKDFDAEAKVLINSAWAEN